MLDRKAKRRLHPEQARRGRGEQAWLWPRRIPMGSFFVLFGDDQTGKTPFCCWVAAQVTRGGFWPFEEGAAPRGRVLYLASEENNEQVVRRVVAMGGNDEMLLRLSERDAEGRWFRLDSAGIERLDELLTRWGDVRLVVFDALKSYLPSENNIEGKMREVLTPMIQTLAKHGAAMVCVMHRTKALAALKPLDLISGSKAYGALARGAMMTHKAEDPASGETRYIVFPVKNSYEQTPNPPAALAFRIIAAEVRDEDDKLVKTVSLEWTDETELTIDEALELERARSRGGKYVVRPRERARAFIEEYLENGPRPSLDVRQAGMRLGFSQRTLYRAWEKLEKAGYAAWDVGGTTWWGMLKDSPRPGGDDADSSGWPDRPYILDQLPPTKRQ
jgi:hypothetical protein